jgi:electron transport complex protein RnfC
MAEARAGLLSRLSRRAGSFGFSHGVHPPEHKELTAHLPIRRMPFPEEVVLPLRQHAGAPARVVVRAGQRVERGDVVAEADGWVSSPVHASASGWVTAVDWWPHPDGALAQAVRIRVEKYSGQLARPRLVPDWEGLDRRALLQAVQDAGVVGLGGAAFPTHVKLSPPPDVTLDTLVVNGAECEPYLTTDHRIMVEYPERVQLGVRITMHLLGVTRCVIGVERNKPDAIEALTRTLPADLDVTVLPLTVKYPQGAEKMLLKSVLGREVPSGKLPATVGAVVQNVGSVALLAEVFETGLPLVERIVTVSGRGVARPQNLLVPVGTKLRDLLDACGGLTADAAEVLVGGPMMGMAQRDLDAPVLKGTTGVVVLDADEVRGRESFPCIHCGRCLDACPMFLNPSLLGDLAKAGRYEEMRAAHLADCMLCGSCSYVCPSNIPLAQLFSASKSALRRTGAA